MIQNLTKLYEGANLSGSTANIIYLPILENSTVQEVDVLTDSAVSGAPAVFSLSKNGVTISGAVAGIDVGSKIGSVTGLNVACVKGDEIVLSLVSGAVSSPVTLNLRVENGVASTLSDEQLQDKIAAFLVPGTRAILIYDDTANTLTLDSIAPTDEEIQDKVAALLAQGSNVTLTYNDGANTLTVAASGGTLAIGTAIGNSPQAGAVLFATGAGTLGNDASALCVDDVNNRIGVAGNTSPAYAIGIGNAAQKGFEQYQSGSVANDALKAINSSVDGATFGVQNTQSTAFSGIEFINHLNDPQVFVGYRNSTGELRINNFASGGIINFRIAGTEKISIINNGNVGVNTATPSCQFDVNGDKMRLRTAKTPASATATGDAGDICWDANYIYICVAQNSWRRAAHSTW
ncbi:MAG TPA: hypothetical protein VF556_08495 [Pyrinomonadaceae bacterium]|jgi:hypothetical protein